MSIKAMAVKEVKDEFEKAYDAEQFKASVPTYSYSVNGSQVSFNIRTEFIADGYEVFRSEKAKSGYVMVASGNSPMQDAYSIDGKSYYYKIRAFHGSGNERTETQFTKPCRIDMVLAAKEGSEKLADFFNALKEVGGMLSFEDLDVAMQSLKVAGLDAREKERRRKAEEEAEKLRADEEKQRKRRAAAVKRAAAIREKKRIAHIESVTRMDLPLDWMNSYSDDERASAHCDEMGDALMMSLDMLGMVDIEFISSITGADMATVIENLRGAIYQNPLHWNEVFYKGWETADEYLSGNLMHKLNVAREANAAYNGYFQNNVTALEGIIDPDIPVGDIYVALGSPWVPTDIIDDFIAFMAFEGKIDTPEAKEYFSACSDSKYATRRDSYTGYWEIPEKTRFRTSHFHGLFEKSNYETYGTNRMDMLYLLENTLNMKTPTISDLKDPSNKNCKERILNQDETIKLIEKQNYMKKAFKEWVWQDEERKARLQAAYCGKFGNVRKRNFNGSFLELPGLSDDIELYDYQKNAVARILFSPNTLLAHEVGSGKTYVMIAAGMELRRLGKSKKNLYVIPNNIISQWETIFLKMYPDADILTVTEKNFSPKKRAETLNRIRDEDHDAILMSYSCFDMLSLSDRYYMKLYQERLDLLKKAELNFYSKKFLNKKEEMIRKALDELSKTYRQKPKVMPFDELGINTLFLDEAHNYKNVDLESHISRVRGFSRTGSTRGNGMMDKVHCIQRMNDGGRIVFATGTPITNSISDIFVMQKYLQEGELEYLEVQNYDAWIGQFAEKTTGFEIDVDTNSYHMVTRFSKFCNIPELTSILSNIIDFHKVDKAAGIPEHDGYEDSVREGSDDFKDYLCEISNRADDIRNRRVTVKEDNMLKLTSDGRKAALDMRLIDTVFGLDPEAKVTRCAENVCEVYNETRDMKGTQLVFCDISTPKEGFNLYDELKNLLVAMGIPEKEIRYIHDADTDLQRTELFKEVREGTVAVLIGSTAKMGHGMNVQDRLAAIHHLDVPWRPSDMVQREGRILRQGNMNEKVKIFRYVTKASFDAYSWQLLETKQRFIGQVMSGTADIREGSDVDDAVLSYAEVKALAVGNPLIKRRVEVSNELDKYRILQRTVIESREKKQLLAIELPNKIEAQKKHIENCQKDIEAYEAGKVDYKSMSYEYQKDIREKIYAAVQLNQNNPVETEVLTYQGFKVVVPAYMAPRIIAKKSEVVNEGEEVSKDSRRTIPYIHLVKNGKYYIEIESKTGITARLNNYLENLGKQKEKYEEVLASMETKLRLINEELEREDTGYTKEIRALETELRKLNKELGVA